MSAASFGGSDGNSDYFKLAKISPMVSTNTPYLEVHFSKLEMIHKVLGGEIYSIS